MNAARWLAVPTYVLHTYPYKETSLIVEAFTANLGRVALVAKGAKRPNSALRGLMQPFLSLSLSFSGKSEIKTLLKAEWEPGVPLLSGNAVMVGYYLNELLLKLLPREDPHSNLFAHYTETLATLAIGNDASSSLRQFELSLLKELGYGVDFSICADSRAPVVAERSYAWHPERGIIERGAASLIDVSGATLIALARAEFADARAAHDAKRFMRAVIDYHLERRALGSRQLLRDVMMLSERAA